MLTWSGATSATVDIYRDGVVVKNVANGGTQLNSKGVETGTTYVYKVCEVGTATCSGPVSVTMQ
jgi:hypothetical protein